MDIWFLKKLHHIEFYKFSLSQFLFMHSYKNINSEEQEWIENRTDRARHSGIDTVLLNQMEFLQHETAAQSCSK